jgi:orotidine-5'-phosphate decarboxylase
MVSPVLLALDYPDLNQARSMAMKMAQHVAGFKVGLELILAEGAHSIGEVASIGLPVFADVKLHDIPNTVAGATRAVAGWGARWVTVHGIGGGEMIEAAVEGFESAGGPTDGVLVVTVLTSLDDLSLVETGVSDDVRGQVARITSLASRSGAGGVVCPPNEVGTAKTAAGELTVVTPGIRGGGSHHDQKLVTTPKAALEAGADYLVVGRAVTASPDPVAALRSLMGAS